ncbi:guanosine 5'-monophosphate oxidoreductase [Bacillus sp. 1NLA3E]|nr:guanosine 5'-monophosphate oxidoreductase [Bacillus sp. 1NLA3E]
MLMIGSLFAGHEESPGETNEKDGRLYKEYFGSASEFQKGEKKNVEGKKILVEHKGFLKDTLKEMKLRSTILYNIREEESEKLYAI